MIAISIVSHGHGKMVESLVSNLLNFPEISSILLTLNIAEELNIPTNPRIIVIKNISPKGFGANHNAAFKMCSELYFCVLNPDILIEYNLFRELVSSFDIHKTGLVSPLVKNSKGGIEDSVRHFLTPASLFLRVFCKKSDAYKCLEGGGFIFSEWVGGMFMLFSSTVFEHINGFDEKYFLYVEDVDICTRVWLNGYKVLVNQNVSVIHNAQRASRKSFKHMLWHIKGIFRYFVKFHKSLPRLK